MQFHTYKEIHIEIVFNHNSMQDAQETQSCENFVEMKTVNGVKFMTGIEMN